MRPKPPVFTGSLNRLRSLMHGPKRVTKLTAEQELSRLVDEKVGREIDAAVGVALNKLRLKTPAEVVADETTDLGLTKLPENPKLPPLTEKNDPRNEFLVMQDGGGETVEKAFEILRAEMLRERGAPLKAHYVTATGAPAYRCPGCNAWLEKTAEKKVFICRSGKHPEYRGGPVWWHVDALEKGGRECNTFVPPPETSEKAANPEKYPSHRPVTNLLPRLDSFLKGDTGPEGAIGECGGPPTPTEYKFPNRRIPGACPICSGPLKKMQNARAADYECENSHLWTEPYLRQNYPEALLPAPAPVATAPETKMTLPLDSMERKGIPLMRGCLRYFPAALAGVALISRLGNDKHNPGQEMHHARGKSSDHGDCVIRHLVDVQDLIAAKAPPDQILHEASQLVWRALAFSQELHEQIGNAPLAPGAKLPE